MPPAPRVTGSELVKALEEAGFSVERIRGSHHRLRRGDQLVTIPVHAGKVIGPGLLKQILDGAGLDYDGLRDLL